MMMSRMSRLESNNTALLPARQRLDARRPNQLQQPQGDARLRQGASLNLASRERRIPVASSLCQILVPFMWRAKL